MSSEFKRLKAKLKARPYLVADVSTGECRLVDQPEAFALMMEAGPGSPYAIVDAGKALDKFAALEGVGKEDREFGMREVAQIAGVSYHVAYAYVNGHEAFPAPVRGFCGGGTGRVEAKWGWAAAYVAGLLGSIKRIGDLRPPALAAINASLGELLGVDVKKRTGRKVSAPARS